MSEEIKIDSDIPPPVVGGRFGKYPWGSVKVGQSFLLLEEDADAAAARAAAKVYAKRTGLSLEFLIRTTPDGVRVWRSK